MNLNPLTLTSGVWSGNYVQPDTTAHPVNANVGSYAVGSDVLALKYTAPPASVDFVAQPITGRPIVTGLILPVTTLR